MDLIEIKNEFENEENKLKTQVGQTLPQRVRKRKLIVKKLKKSRKNFKRNKHVEIEYLKITLSYPRDRLARQEKMLKDEVKYLKTVSLHTGDGLPRLEKMLKEEIEYLKTVPSHLRDILARLEKKLNNKTEYLKATPSHPRDEIKNPQR